MKKIFFLSSCSTCQRIMNEIGVNESWIQQDIKKENINEATLDLIYSQTKSYDAIFSKKAMKYRSMALKDIIKKDEDYKKYILEEYTFISRPIIQIDDRFFIGNSKKNIDNVKLALQTGE
jgi:arsenate reductase (glutaredoxin)